MAAVATTIDGMRPPRVLLSVAFALGAGVAGCGGSGSSPPTVPLGPNDVLVANFTFSPLTLTVKAGTTVTWRFDQESSPHNVVSISSPVLFNSGGPKGKGTFSFTFTAPGTYPYLCQVHPTMRGTIVVTP
jgi:plastocyanin